MADPAANSAMAREVAEIPAASALLLARADLFAAIADRIEEFEPRIVVFCGRGSSGHVGVYLRYLFETRLGWITSAAAPSVMTAYQRPPDFRESLFIVISQSGRSPDLLAATQVARTAGALTLALVNDQDFSRGFSGRACTTDRGGTRAFGCRNQNRGSVDGGRCQSGGGACQRHPIARRP